MSSVSRASHLTIRAGHWLLIGGWLLMTPPTPLKTSLPPLSEWSKVSTHKTSQECERTREEMRTAARRMIKTDANAHALELAAALGRLQSRCIETAPTKAAGTETAADAPGAPATGTAAAPAARPPVARPPVANQPPGADEPKPVSDDPGAVP
jgi:hypothetical protein